MMYARVTTGYTFDGPLSDRTPADVDVLFDERQRRMQPAATLRHDFDAPLLE
jgi:hypothetical protein